MFKRTLSMLLCIVMFVGCFGGVVSSAANNEYPANSIFAITTAPVKDNLIRYTINMTANQKGVAGTVLLVEFDSNVLSPVGCGPAFTSTTSSGEINNFEGEFLHGITEDSSNTYSIAYVNTTSVSTGSTAKPFFNMIFEVIDDTRPLTDVKFYCAEYYSVSEAEKNITKQQLIKSFENVATLEAPQLVSVVPAQDGLTVSWLPVVGADGYAVYRSTPSDGREIVYEAIGNDATSYTDTGLESGVNYTYTVTALNNYGESAYDSNGLLCKYIAKPHIEYVRNVDGGVELRWNACNGATNYYVMRRVAGEEEWQRIAIRSASVDTYYKDKTVSDGVEYEYDVKSATNTFESAAATEGEKIVYIEAPSLLAVSNVYSGIELKWSLHKDSTGYVIYRRVNGVDETLVKYKELNTTSFIDTQVDIGVAYTYSVMTITNKGSSAYNTLGYTITRVPATEVTSLQLNSSSVTVEWAPVENIDGYVVYRKPTSSDVWQKVCTVSSDVTSVDDKGAVSGTQYVYAVTPLKNNSEGVKAPSQPIYYIASPKSVTAVNEIDGIVVSWERVNGASSYAVYRDDGSGEYLPVDVVNGDNNTSYLDTDVYHGQKYSYKIIAINTSSGESKASEDVADLLRWNEEITAVPSYAAGGMLVDWADHDVADSFILYRSSGEEWLPIAETTESCFLDTSVVSDKKYSYAVGLIIEGSISVVYKPSELQIRYIAPPSVITTSNGTNYTKVSWSAVEGAQKYYLYKASEENGTYKLIGTFNSSTLSYTDKNVVAGAAAYYSIRCYNGENTSVYSASTKNVFLQRPTISGISNVYTGQTIKWNAIKGATGYKIYSKIYGGTYKCVATVDAGTLSYTYEAPVNGKKMVYAVRAINGDSISAYQGKTAVYLDAPEVSMYNGINGVVVSWDENTAADGYYVYRKVAGAKNWSRIAYVKTTKYTDKAAKSGTTYLYTVKAYDGSKLSGCNMDGWKIRFFSTPVITSVANSYGGVTISWKKVSYAQSYNVYRKANNDTSWTLIDNVVGLSYVDKDVKNLSTYTYTVRAVNRSNKSNYNHTGKTVKYVTAPKVSVSNSTSGVYLDWDRVSGASSYYVYRKAGNATKWTKIGTVRTNYYLDTSVKEGVIYTYTVRAYASKTLSGYYKSGWKVRHLDTPKLVSAVSSTSGITVKWQKVSYATAYDIYRKADGEKSWTRLGRVTGNSKVTYLDKKVIPGETYTYTVRACNGSYRSWFYSGIECRARY